MDEIGLFEAIHSARAQRRFRPDPVPEVFGFHELFHAFVIAAAACHFIAMAGWVIV